MTIVISFIFKNLQVKYEMNQKVVSQDLNRDGFVA